MGKKEILTRGLIKENPVLVLVLGLCPTLAVSTLAENAIGMGLATTFVLLGSNIVISLLRNIIPDKVRIPCYIVLIASFTVLAEMAIEAYAYPLYQSLGIFLPLIAVNCIIFARAEMFANKNNTFNSVLDALGRAQVSHLPCLRSHRYGRSSAAADGSVLPYRGSVIIMFLYSNWHREALSSLPVFWLSLINCPKVKTGKNSTARDVRQL